ncbi:MAG: DUF1802 family protein [Candidatus Binatia bacterium]|nr:DUF1802 family protein [Candidatus Binatia bacterium]
MLSTNRLALKEWAAIIHALGTGQQILLLRKGGLYERQGRFTPTAREFFLFPTYVHQMTQGVTSRALSALHVVEQQRPPAEEVHLTFYATVHEIRWLDDFDCVASLADFHWWTPETIAHRFAYGKTPGLSLLVLRVYRLPQPFVLPHLKRYAGCRSWIELAEALPTTGAQAILSDAAFAERLHELTERLSRCRAA